MQFNQVNIKEMLVFLCIYCMSMMERFAWQSAVSSIHAQAHVGHAISVYGLFGTTLGRALCGLPFFFKWLFPALVLFLFFCFSLKTNHVSINKQQPFHQRVASYIITPFLLLQQHQQQRLRQVPQQVHLLHLQTFS